MTREDYEEMKRLLAETQAELREGNLSPVLTAALEHCCAVTAEALELLHPIDWARRTIMIVQPSVRITTRPLVRGLLGGKL
jgi:hypothetical protein